MSTQVHFVPPSGTSGPVPRMMVKLSRNAHAATQQSICQEVPDLSTPGSYPAAVLVQQRARAGDVARAPGAGAFGTYRDVGRARSSWGDRPPGKDPEWLVAGK